MVTFLLIVEPIRETRLALITSFGRCSHPFKVWSAICAQEALQILEHESIDLVISELQLPDMSGFLFLDYIPHNTHIIVYSDGDESVVLRAYEHQIDDFAVKSRTSISELVLRTSAILRRAKQQSVHVGDIYVDIPAKRVWNNANEIDFSSQQFKFLLELVRHPNQIRTREQLAHAVGSTQDAKGYRVLHVLALAVRQKLEVDHTNPQYIQNVRGVGYMFKSHLQ